MIYQFDGITMFKKLIASGAFVSLLAMPAASFAQDTAEPTAQQDTVEPAVEQEATAETVQPRRVLAPVNYDMQEDRDNILLLDLSNGKRVAIRLMPDWAPSHVDRVKTLTRQGFYDGVIFHRVIDGFMAQTGDPTGTGQGGSQLPDLTAEFNRAPHVRGTVSMARAQSDDSANSQFFIVFYPRFALDQQYTNFGRVMAGMDAVDVIQRGEPPANPTRVVQASIAADNKPVPAFVPAPAADITLPSDVQEVPQVNGITEEQSSAPVGE